MTKKLHGTGWKWRYRNSWKWRSKFFEPGPCNFIVIPFDRISLENKKNRFLFSDVPLSSKGERTILRCGNTYDLEGVKHYIQKQPSLYWKVS